MVTKLIVMFALALLVLTPGSGQAQTQRTQFEVRPGDTIEWYAHGNAPHKVRFGAPDTTSVEDVQKLLDFTPALSNGDSPNLAVEKPFVAKVKDLPENKGKTFVFVCGIHSNGPMLSLPFIIGAKVDGAPARTHKIMGIGPPLHWTVHVDTTHPK